MLLEISECEYDDIIYALKYAIIDLNGEIEAGKAHSENFRERVKSMKKTEKYITEFWNADRDR